jgi:hypothetical protein
MAYSRTALLLALQQDMGIIITDRIGTLGQVQGYNGTQEDICRIRIMSWGMAHNRVCTGFHACDMVFAFL